MHDFLVSPLSLKNRRPQNQDAFGHFDTPYGSLFIICDGFGPAGAQASQQTVASFPRHLENCHAQGMAPSSALKTTTQSIHNRLAQEYADPNTPQHGSGTTLVLGLQTAGGMYIGHVGDSRAYLVEPSKVTPLTRDHNKVTQWLNEGRLTEEEARNHPQAHVLTKALGAQAPISLELRERPLQLKQGQAVFFCSDGLTGFVDDSALSAILTEEQDASNAIKALAERAIDQGSDDNITILLARNPILQNAPAAIPPKNENRVTATESPDQLVINFPTPRPGTQTKPRHRKTPNPAAKTPMKHGAQIIKADSGVPWWLYALGLLLAVILTLVHFNSLWGLSFRSISVSEELAEAEPADIEFVENYDWRESECKETLVEQVRSMAADFERELRDAAALTDQEEMDLGARYHAEVKILYGERLDSDPTWVSYLTTLGQTLAQQTTRPGIEYRFHYIDDETVNAFAMPGGHIYVFRGLLDKMIQNEATLAFLLGHEISHVEMKHCVSLMGIMNQIPGMHDTSKAFLSKFLNHAFSIEFELEADRNGMMMAMKADYSPFQGGIFIREYGEKMYQAKGGPTDEQELLEAMIGEAASILETHPNPTLRFCRYKNMVLDHIKRDPVPYYYLGEKNYAARITMKEQTF